MKKELLLAGPDSTLIRINPSRLNSTLQSCAGVSLEFLGHEKRIHTRLCEVITCSIELFRGKLCFDEACPICVYLENRRVDFVDTVANRFDDSIHTNAVIKSIRFDFTNWSVLT